MNSETKESLSKLVIAMGTMSESQLQEAKLHFSHKIEDSDVRGLFMTLADLYISVGPDPHRRAAAATDLPMAINVLMGINAATGASWPIEKRSGKKATGCLVALVFVAGGTTLTALLARSLLA
jgi:hypothetical protein